MKYKQIYEWRYPENATITKHGPPEAPKEWEMRNKYGHHKSYNHDNTSCQRMVIININIYVVREKQL